MKKLRAKLIKIDQTTNWHQIAVDCGRVEDQLRMRADLGTTIKRIEQQTGEERYVPNFKI